MQINHEKITREFCKGKILLFFPRSAAEARLVRDGFRALDFDMSGAALNIAQCVKTGMVFQNGDLSSDPSAYSLKNGYHCQSEQFHDKYNPEHALLIELFNKMAGRIDELAAKVDEIYEHVQPGMNKAPAKKKV